MPPAASAARLEACDPTTAPERLAALAADPDVKVRLAVAANPRCPVALLEALAADREPRVRTAVAQHAAAPPALLAKLAGDAGSTVRRWVAWNANAPDDVIERLARDRAPAVRASVVLLGDREHPPARLDRLAGDPDAAVRVAVARHCAGRAQANARPLPEARESFHRGYWIATSAGPEFPCLERLVDDVDPAVRCAVGEVGSLAPALVARLARDPDAGVRRLAARHLAASPEVLTALADDPDRDVRWLVWIHPATPEGVRARLPPTL